MSDRRIEWFATPVGKAVRAFLVQLANGYETSFGTFFGESCARFSFEVIGFFLSN